MLIAAGVRAEEARLAGIDARENVARVETPDELEGLLADATREWDAVIVGAGIEAPLQALRRVKARAPHVPVLLLASPERCARIQHELLLAPLPGAPARCVPLGPAAPQAIEAHLVQAKLRRRHRRAIERANLTPAAPHAMGVRLPGVVERFFDATPVGILLVDARGNVTYRNLLARRLTPDRRAVGTIQDALPDAQPEALRRLLDPPEDRPRERITVREGEGAPRHFEATSARVHVGQGQTMTLVTLDEVTPLVEAEARLEEARAAAVQVDKLASMGSLVAGLAHEIRTPLTAIQNNAMMIDVLARRALEGGAREDLESLPEHAHELSQGVDRINDLIRDLNRFLRNQRAEKARVPLSAAVGDAVRLFEAAHRGAFRVRTDLRSSVEIHADAAQVQQVALNLLQNAADASPPGGTVRVGTRDAAEGVELVVADQGRGIPPEIQGKMYEAFVTTKPEGSGLGLSIVRRIVEAHGARVSFDTGAGGTTFVVWFPRAEAEPVAKP